MGISLIMFRILREIRGVRFWTRLTQFCTSWKIQEHFDNLENANENQTIREKSKKNIEHIGKMNEQQYVQLFVLVLGSSIFKSLR